MTTLLIIILVIYIGGWLFRLLAPRLLMSLFKHGAGKQYNAAQQKTRKEGEVNVHPMRKREKKKITKEVGEYVEFEEVK